MLRGILYNADATLNKRNLLLIGGGLLALLMMLSLGLFVVVRDIQRAPTLTEVENELAEIVPPPGATVTQHNSIYKWTYGNVGNYYRANLTYEQIRAYYDVELARHGWKFRKQIPLTSWGKDLGESQTFYCKGDRAVDIYFTGNAQLGYRYALNVDWGWNDCD
jgi:hypothetical protein